jgi:hypothetical protein
MTSFQLGTRQLHNICSYSKEKKDVMLMKIVPNLKKSLETFIFAMKDVLAVNDVVGAFWLGNLRHRDISGIAVSSQLPVDEHRGDETPAVEDDAPSTKKRGRTKKTGRATATTADDKPSKPSKKKSKTSDKPKKSKKKKAESDEEVEEEEEAELEDIEEDVPEANRMHYEVADDDMDVDNNGYDEDDALAPILGIGESADDYGGFDEAVEFVRRRHFRISFRLLHSNRHFDTILRMRVYRTGFTARTNVSINLFFLKIRSDFYL